MMRSLLTILLSLLLATFVAWRFLGAERRPPETGATTPAATPAGAARDAGGGDSSQLASRTLLDGRAAPEHEPAVDDPRTDAPQPDERAARAALLARVEERFRRQSDTIGEALALTAADRERLFEVLLGEYERRAEFFEELHERDFDQEMRERVRAELAGIQEWKTGELQVQLGAELALAVAEFERRGSGSTNDGDGGRFERDGKERSEN